MLGNEFVLGVQVCHFNSSLEGGLPNDVFRWLEVHVFIGHCANNRSFSGSRPVELIVAAEGTELKR